MKNNIVLIITRILYAMFAIGTITSLFIVYKDIDNDGAFKFLMGYLFFTLFLLVYIPLVTILNSRKFKWIEIRKRLFKFITLFILFGALNYVFDYIFRPSKIDLYKEFSIALGLAFGISFMDVTFFKRKM